MLSVIPQLVRLLLVEHLLRLQAELSTRRRAVCTAMAALKRTISYIGTAFEGSF